MRRIVFAFFAVIAGVVMSGCSVFTQGNNHLHPADFVRQLHNDGLKIDMVRLLAPEPLGASEALEVRIGKSNIGIYKYDIHKKAQKERLKKIQQSKRVFFNGFPYPIYETSGSFIVVGLDKHKDKKRILESLRNFR